MKHWDTQEWFVFFFGAGLGLTLLSFGVAVVVAAFKGNL